MKRYSLKCEPITPIHIGSGEEVEAYEYVIGQKFYKIDLNKLLDSLPPEKQEIVLKMLEENIISYRNFLKKELFERNPSLLSQVSSYSISISKKVSQIYQAASDKPESLLPIKLFQRSLNHPFVPGSSIKGAIRTAILFSLWSSSQIPLLKRCQPRYLKTNRWEGVLLKSEGPHSDPLKAVKVSDSLNEFDTVILDAEVYTNRSGRWVTDGYQILIETVFKSSFELELTIDEELQAQAQRLNRDFLKITIDQIVNSCNRFYTQNFESEAKRLFSNQSVPPSLEKIQKEIDLIKFNSGQNLFLLRFGWGSGFDAVTLSQAEGFNQIIRLVDQRRANPKKSVKLVQGCLPLGWLKVSVREL